MTIYITYTLYIYIYIYICNMICTYPAMFNPFFLKPMIFGETDMNSLSSGTNCQAWLIIDLHFFVKTS